MFTHRNKFRINMAARNFLVQIRFRNNPEYEGRIAIHHGERGAAIKLTPGPDGFGDLTIHRDEMDDVVDINLTTIKIELKVPMGAFVVIKFGCRDSKDSIRRSIRADSNNDSGVSSGEPSPLAAAEQ